MIGLIALYTTVRLTILADASMLGRLVVITIAASRRLPSGSPASLSTLLTGLDGINLAAGELAANALVRLTVLAEAVVLCVHT